MTDHRAPDGRTLDDRTPDDRPTVDDADVQLAVGDVVELSVGSVAHGGHCVARHHGRVVFVRHALPGEQVRARITEAKPGSFCRADALEVLTADPRRVPAPCSHFGPGGCGGCDFQHASGELQRELKATVIREQLLRLAKVELDPVVEALPGSGFGWRTRVRWGRALRDGRAVVGPRLHRSAQLVDVTPTEPCLIASGGLSALAVEVGDGAAVESDEWVLMVAEDGSEHTDPGRRVGS